MFFLCLRLYCFCESGLAIIARDRQCFVGDRRNLLTNRERAREGTFQKQIKRARGRNSQFPPVAIGKAAL